MNRIDFVNEWADRLDGTGRLIRDPRFTVTFVDTGPGSGHLALTCELSEHGQTNTVYHWARTTSDALTWMLSQPLPRGSLRLGNVISRATRAFGIEPCNACKQRQLALNAAKGFKP